MTRKDYEAFQAMVAQEIAQCREACATRKEPSPVDWARLEQTYRMRDRIADTFQADNPRFSRDRFLSACDPDTLEQGMA